MYKLSDEYWLALARTAALIVIAGFVIFHCIDLIWQLEQYFFDKDIEGYLATNNVEPPRDLQDGFRKASKLKTIPLTMILFFAINYLSFKYWSKPKSK